MTNQYPIILAALLSGGAYGQAHPLHRDQRTADHPKAAFHLSTAGSAKAGGGACIFSEDFSGSGLPAGWSIGNAIATVPATTPVPAWIIGNATSANAAGNFTVPDEPVGNTFAMANDDAPPCDCAMSDIGLETPSIDLTGQSGMGLSFRLFHDGRFGNSSAKVEVSTDGGQNYTTLQELPAVVGVWHKVTIGLAAVENLADVRFRFQFDDGGDWVSGMAVDDVCVGALPDNDLVINEGFISDISASYDDAVAANLEYTFIPLEQAGPMTFAVSMSNSGAQAQTNIRLTATINGTDYVSEPYASLASGATDTLIFHSTFTPSSTGSYAVQLSLTADATDANPSDNTTSRTWVVTGPGSSVPDKQMGTDGDDLNGFVLLSTGPDVSGDINSIGSKIEIGNAGSLAYGIGVVLYQRSHVGALMDAFLLEDDPVDGLSLVASTDNMEITAEMLNGAGGNGLVYLPFDPVASDPNVLPVVLDPTKDYVVFAEALGADTVSVGLSGIVQPGGIWDVSNTSDPAITQYIGSGNSGAMVRLFLGPSTAGITELNSSNAQVTLGANMPNPFNGSTTVQYSLKERRDITLRIHDMAGHLIMVKAQGEQGPGQHLIDLDGTQLAPGVYTYSLQAGQDRLTRRMVVTN